MRDLILYHGTTWASAVSIKKYGIDLSFSKVFTDFGRGFYLTDDKRTAIDWAKSRGVRDNSDGGLIRLLAAYNKGYIDEGTLMKRKYKYNQAKKC